MHIPELGQELLAVVARLNRWATRNATLDVSPAQGRLLAQLEEIGPARIGDLAKADRCSQPTMTAQVQRLEAEGWTTRRADPADARATLIALSASGQEALTQVRRARSAVVAPLIGRLDSAERQSLHESLTVLGRVLDAATDGSAPATPLVIVPLATQPLTTNPSAKES